MAGKKERELAENIKSLQQNIELIDVPEVKQKVMEKIGHNVEVDNMELA